MGCGDYTGHEKRGAVKMINIRINKSGRLSMLTDSFMSTTGELCTHIAHCTLRLPDSFYPLQLAAAPKGGLTCRCLPMWLFVTDETLSTMGKLDGNANPEWKYKKANKRTRDD